MNEIADRLVRIALLAAAAGLAYFYVDSLRSRLDAANASLTTASEAMAIANNTITELRELDHKREVAAARLEGEHNAIRDAASGRELLMRKLQDENADIRAWAAAAVPGDVVRLREHATFTGATAYRQFLSQGATLQSARRSDPE